MSEAGEPRRKGPHALTRPAGGDYSRISSFRLRLALSCEEDDLGLADPTRGRAYALAAADGARATAASAGVSSYWLGS